MKPIFLLYKFIVLQMCQYCYYLNVTHMLIAACICHREPVATCFVLNPLDLHPWFMVYVSTAYDFSDLSGTFVCDVHLPLHAAINHNGLIIVY
jgi:hypothetical protein